MPQTYMRTSLGRRGLNSSFSPLNELWILSMRLQPSPRGFRRHQFEELREFRAVQLTGQCHSQGHEQSCALAARALLENSGEHLEVSVGLLIGGSGRGEKFRAGRSNDPLL